MSPEEIVEEGWPIIVAYYEGSSRRYTCNSYIRDLMWDMAVDVLLCVSRHYDGRIPLVKFLQWACRRNWIALVYRRKPLERMLIERSAMIMPNDTELMALGEEGIEDNGFDIVDGADLCEVAKKHLPANQLEALEIYIADRRPAWTKNSIMSGELKQTLAARAKLAIRKLQELTKAG